MIDANIPIQYRKWTFKNLERSFINKNRAPLSIVKQYIEKLGENIRKGNGLWFFSPTGLAKSSIICNILKKAIKQGFNPYFIRASHIVSLKFQAMRHDPQALATLSKMIRSTHILAIEEIEKVYLAEQSSMPNQHFYEFISDVYDANIALLISSNKVRDEYENTLPLFVRDRFKSLTSVPFFGKSGRSDRRRAHT
jgi:hypothetical protein